MGAVHLALLSFSYRVTDISQKLNSLGVQQILPQTINNFSFLKIFQNQLGPFMHEITIEISDGDFSNASGDETTTRVPPILEVLLKFVYLTQRIYYFTLY